MVRSLPVVVENRKYVVIPSVRVQRQYSYDADFLYGRLLCSKNCVVKKLKVERWIFKRKKIISSCSVRRLSIIVFLMLFSLFPVVSYGNQQFQNRSSCLEPDIELHDE